MRAGARSCDPGGVRGRHAKPGPSVWAFSATSGRPDPVAAAGPPGSPASTLVPHSVDLHGLIPLRLAPSAVERLGLCSRPFAGREKP
jgi:hypothetical protein